MSIFCFLNVKHFELCIAWEALYINKVLLDDFKSGGSPEVTYSNRDIFFFTKWSAVQNTGGKCNWYNVLSQSLVLFTTLELWTPGLDKKTHRRLRRFCEQTERLSLLRKLLQKSSLHFSWGSLNYQSAMFHRDRERKTFDNKEKCKLTHKMLFSPSRVVSQTEVRGRLSFGQWSFWVRQLETNFLRLNLAFPFALMPFLSYFTFKTKFTNFFPLLNVWFKRKSGIEKENYFENGSLYHFIFLFFLILFEFFFSHILYLIKPTKINWCTADFPPYFYK